MGRHTPGPWQYSRRNWRGEEQLRDWYVVGNVREDGDGCRVGTSVCIVPGNMTSHPICEDTARLIAAAPDLLAAVRSLVGAIIEECGEPEEDESPMAEAVIEGRDAIAKATGRF